MNVTEQLQAVAAIATAAGAEILEVYERSGAVQVSLKDDRSPITEADRRAHRLIVQRLGALTPDIPILSEESDSIPFATRKSWQRYWLVDPLDGTKEFVKRNGEFTVNIALIEDGIATLGVVHVPVTGVTYGGAVGVEAWVKRGEEVRVPVQCAKIATQAGSLRVVASRSHRDAGTEAILAQLRQAFPRVEEVSMGSSLKICLLAEGRADFYPRLAPTSEWDTAAAHAVLRAAGGDIVDTRFQSLRYNQKDRLLNPDFLALADPGFEWQSLLKGSIPG